MRTRIIGKKINNTMKSPSSMTRFTMICLWPMVMSAHAFASTTSTTSSSCAPSSLQSLHRSPLLSFQKKCNHRQTFASSSSLNLNPARAIAEFIPRGGGASAVVGGVASKVSEWTSTPNGAFNCALAVLAASTAVLKISNQAKSGDGGDESGAVVSCLLIGMIF